MATIFEHDSLHDGNMSPALTAFVAVIAILVVFSIALYTLGIYRFNAQPLADTTLAPSANVNVQGALPGTNPSGQ